MSSLMNGSSRMQVPGSPLESAAQGARRATVAAPSNGAPDPEVAPTAKRRQFSGAEKQRIVQAAARCTKPGELGALLRAEGIYSSMLLANWRKQRAHTEEVALRARKRGRKPDPALPEARRFEQLQRDNDRLRRSLAQAHMIIDVQKNSARCLGYQ